MPLPKRRVQVFISEMAGDALDMIVARTGKTQTAAIEEAILGSKDFFGFDPERDGNGSLVSPVTAAMLDEMHRQIERENDHGSVLPSVPLDDRLLASSNPAYREPVAENSLSPEAVAIRAERKAVRAERKAALSEQARAGLKAITGAMPDFPDKACFHPAQSRTTGKNWKCIACGYQQVSV